MDAVDEFTVFCHCGKCRDAATITRDGDGFRATWRIGWEDGVSVLTAGQLSAACENGCFDFARLELHFDFDTADRLEEWAGLLTS